MSPDGHGRRLRCWGVEFPNMFRGYILCSRKSITRYVTTVQVPMQLVGLQKIVKKNIVRNQEIIQRSCCMRLVASTVRHVSLWNDQSRVKLLMQSNFRKYSDLSSFAVHDSNWHISRLQSVVMCMTSLSWPISHGRAILQGSATDPVPRPGLLVASPLVEGSSMFSHGWKSPIF